MLLLQHNEPIQISISGALASCDGLLAHTQTGVGRTNVMTLPRSHSRAWTRFSNVTPIDALQEIYETGGIRTSSHSVAVRSQRVSPSEQLRPIAT